MRFRRMQVLNKLCPKCSRFNCLYAHSGKETTTDGAHCLQIYTTIDCITTGCSYTLCYKRDMICPYDRDFKRFLPVEFDTGDLKGFFDYNGAGYRALDLWGSICNMRFSRELWKSVNNIFGFMLLSHAAQWDSIVYKILEPYRDFIHPDLIEDFILPMLGFDQSNESIRKKLSDKYKDWKAAPYSGAQFLFGE